MHEPTEQRIHKRRETPIGCLSPYMRTCVRTLLPLRAEHAEVALVTPLCILLSGGEEFVCLFRELLCYSLSHCGSLESSENGFLPSASSCGL